MPNLKVGVPYYVEWNDATSYTGWRSTKESSKLVAMKIKSIGWLVYADASKVVLALSWSVDEDQTNQCVLPRGWITKMKRITV